MAEACEILVVGNYCHDTLIGKDGSEHRVLGGSAAYVSAVLGALGVRFRTVAKVGRDFRHAGAAPVPPLVEGARTAAFVDDYRGGERRETLEAAGPRIRPEDVGTSCELAIACAVAGEVPPETLLALRGRCRLLLADAQGLVRTFGPAGEVGIAPLARTPFAEAARAIDHLKVGGAERAAIDPAALPGALLFTEGERGCTLLAPPGPDGSRERTEVPAFPAIERDATGAGDCFLAGYAVGLLRGLAPAAAARAGAFCGARAVEQVGVPRIDPAALAPLLRRPRRIP